jgi:IstB-like ATP binding protein
MWISTFIDDMGLKILPPKSGEVLLEIIMRRYENRSTMMTSNRPIEEWGKLLSDVPAAPSTTLRLSPSPDEATDSSQRLSSPWPRLTAQLLETILIPVISD